MRAILLAAIAAIATIGLVGCVGQLDSGGGGMGGGGGGGGGGGMGSGSAADTARLAFENNVYPTLAAKCGSSSCHLDSAPGAGAPAFFDPTDPTTDSTHKAYNTVVGLDSVVGGFTTSAPILAIPQGSHFASYTADEITAITNWLTLELAWRDAGSGTAPVDYMAQFSGCLLQTDFDTYQMATSWAENIETNEGYCKQCHVNATAHMIATPQDTYMFDEITQDRAVMATFFMVDTTQTPNKVIINQTPFKLAAAGLTPSGQHTRGWDPLNNPGMQALQSWYTAAEGYLTATPSTCGTSTLTN